MNTLPKLNLLIFSFLLLSSFDIPNKEEIEEIVIIFVIACIIIFFTILSISDKLGNILKELKETNQKLEKINKELANDYGKLGKIKNELTDEFGSLHRIKNELEEIREKVKDIWIKNG